MSAAAYNPAYDQGIKLSSQGRHAEAIAKFEQALAQAPHDTKVLFALGNTANQLGLGPVAEQFFRQVLALEPQRLEAIVNLANLLRGTAQFEAAIALLEPALARQPQSPELHLTLGSALREKGDFQKARDHYQAALATRPNYTPALANLADMASDAGDRDQARTLYDQAIKLDPKNPQIRLNRAILHFLNDDLKDAWRDYAARIEVPGKVPVVAGEQRLAPWTGGALKRVRLLVRSEQGVGDQLMFASLMPDLAAKAKADGGSLILECEPRLVSLFARSFPDVTVRPAVIKTQGGVPTADYGWLKAAGGANATALMGSLPKYLRGTREAFLDPHWYLVPEPAETARWREAFGSGTRKAIGISWRSGKAGGNSDRMLQYAPLKDWAQFIKTVDANFVCAQYGATDEEITALQEMSGRKILVPEKLDQKNELDRTCAMLAALDVVISAPTAVAWLAAGAGVPTLKLLYGPVWTAMGQSHEPFAPACACLSPAQMGDWQEVFGQATEALTKLP
jgi:Flp pilus assembly protein TadD